MGCGCRATGANGAALALALLAAATTARAWRRTRRWHGAVERKTKRGLVAVRTGA
ncbi:MAG: MYXO-CTERM sorting domain-containing protein [Myxococcaceae bacterium]